jgi:Tfp pilus assembly protein PilF
MNPRTPPTLFLSYSWRDSNTADQVDSDLRQLQVTIIRDVRDLEYRARISDFMKQIRDADFAVLLISDSYLKSLNCMREALHLLDERHYERKLLPIILPETKLYSTSDRLGYTQYWNEQRRELEAEIARHSATAAISAIKDLRVVEQVYQRINDFISYIADMKHLSFQQLKEEGYKSLLHELGFADVSHLVDLLILSMVSDLDVKEALLDEWFDKYAPIAQAYRTRADIAKAKHQFERAERNYQRALEMDPKNAYTLNNYGYMLMENRKDTEAAKELFLKAISIMPSLTVARLNLGVLLGREGNFAAAASEYRYVIAHDPTEAKAYNNLANIFRRTRPFHPRTIARVCSLFEKALELKPHYVEALMNYANYLCEFVYDFDRAEEFASRLPDDDQELQTIKEFLLNRINHLRSTGRPAFSPENLCPCNSGRTYGQCCGHVH